MLFRSIRGAEVTRGDVERRLESLGERLASLPAAVAHDLAAFEQAVRPGTGSAPGVLDLFFGEFRVRLRLALMRRHLEGAGVDVGAVHDAVARLESLRAVFGSDTEMDVVGAARAWLDARAPFDELLAEQRSEAVSLLTFHAAKGREWWGVVVAGAEDGLVPHSSASTPDQLEIGRAHV